MPPEPVISTVGLTKHFDQIRALNDFSLNVHRGEIVGLLGPNGSGKSTLVRLLMGYLRPTAGSASILGLDCWTDRVAVHRKVAYLPGDARLFRSMRGKDVLRFFGAIRGNQFLVNAKELTKRFDLDLSRWVAFMSTGMRQKLALSVSMAIGSPLLILDEPTANLDPTVRQEVLSLVSEAQSDGRTIVFSSHVLDEIESVCSKAVILREGNLVHEQSMTDGSKGYQIRFETDVMPVVPDEMAKRVTVEPADRSNDDGKEYLLKVDGELNTVLEWMATLQIDKVRVRPVDLRTIYDRFHRNGGGD